MSDTIRSEEREKAELLSRNCQVCNGAGMVIVFHHRWAKSRFVMVATERNGEIIETEVPAEVSGHCFCELGQWMRSRTTEYLKRRMPDGNAILEGHSSWLFQPPGSDPDERYKVPTRAAMSKVFGKIKEAF